MARTHIADPAALRTSPVHIILASILAACCFLVSTAAGAPGQQARQSSQGTTIKSSSVVVDVYAVVEGRHGRLIRDLKKDDFEITDNGTKQEIEYFSPQTNMALSLGVALDTSASQSRILGTEQTAANQFLVSVLQKDDQAFVMSFDVDVRLLADFTSATSELARAIDSAEINQTGRSIVLESAANSRGGTHLYDAVYLASDELMKARFGRKVLVLLTDGDDQGSKANLQESIDAAEKANLIVYSIVVSDPEMYSLLGGSYHGDASVRKLARMTGGRTIRVGSVEHLGQAFERIEQELRSQYLLGYTPSNLRHDGEFRPIRVKVRGHNYVVQTRAGYYDRGATGMKP